MRSIVRSVPAARSTIAAPRDGTGRAVAWMKVNEDLGDPTDAAAQLLHRSWLAYLSDDLPTDSVIRAHPVAANGGRGSVLRCQPRPHHLVPPTAAGRSLAPLRLHLSPLHRRTWSVDRPRVRGRRRPRRHRGPGGAGARSQRVRLTPRQCDVASRDPPCAVVDADSERHVGRVRRIVSPMSTVDLPALSPTLDRLRQHVLEHSVKIGNVHAEVRRHQLVVPRHQADRVSSRRRSSPHRCRARSVRRRLRRHRRDRWLDDGR